VYIHQPVAGKEKQMATTITSTQPTMSGATMKAIISSEFGPPDVLRLQEVEKPVIGDDGVLVRVRAASVNPLDWHLMRGEPYIARFMGMGLRRPRDPARGIDVAGMVEAVGKDVTQFRPGDAVFGMKGGALAEYVAGKERNFVPKPAGITFEQAAAIPVAGVTALQALRDFGHLQPGQSVLINGAAGGVGTFAVQIAKAFGGHVIAVTSTRNLELVRSIGAGQVVDYTRDDFTRSGQRYDLILDNVGNCSLRRLRRILAPEGTLVLVGGKSGRWVGAMPRYRMASILSRFVDQTLVKFHANIGKDDALVLKELVEAGKVTPVIDRVYPLAETREAFRYLEAGHARAKVVITV
jgi:NADPH:quinone reductase-like Zn-dependent oxidoreductase